MCSEGKGVSSVQHGKMEFHNMARGTREILRRLCSEGAFFEIWAGKWNLRIWRGADAGNLAQTVFGRRGYFIGSARKNGISEYGKGQAAEVVHRLCS